MNKQQQHMPLPQHSASPVAPADWAMAKQEPLSTSPIYKYNVDIEIMAQVRAFLWYTIFGVFIPCCVCKMRNFQPPLQLLWTRRTPGHRRPVIQSNSCLSLPQDWLRNTTVKYPKLKRINLFSSFPGLNCKYTSVHFVIVCLDIVKQLEYTVL